MFRRKRPPLSGGCYYVLIRWFLIVMAFSMLPVVEASAQLVYNRKYTLNSSSSYYFATAPLGDKGACMALAEVVDSVTGVREIKVLRLDAHGDVAHSAIFHHPDYPRKTLQGIFHSLARVHNNLYAMVTYRFVDGVQSGSCIFTIDSNGSIQNQLDVLEPVALAKDSFSYLGAVKYDGWGHLIVAGHDFSELDTNHNLLMKFDTSLNLLWKKKYRRPGLPGLIALELSVQDGRYLIWGGAFKKGLGWTDTFYRMQSMIRATDTSGDELWQYTSPLAGFYDCESPISCGIPTSDGGYLYVTMTDVYNASKGTNIDPWGKAKLVKLDATRRRIWEKDLEKFNLPFNQANQRLMELEDHDFVLMHLFATDSFSIGDNYYDFRFSRYHADGSLVYHRKLVPLKDPKDTDRLRSSWGFLDFFRTDDNGFVMGGSYRNETPGGADGPVEKGWLLRLDSTVCKGSGDPDCEDASAIRNTAHFANVFKVYPNPSAGSFTISSATQNGGFSSSILNAIVYDVLGRPIHKESLRIQTGNATLRFTAPDGFYVLELTDAEGKIHREKIEVRSGIN